MPRTVARGAFIMPGRVIPNEILQAGFDYLGAVLTGQSQAVFSAIALLDVDRNEIVSRNTTFTPENIQGGGVRITANTIFQGSTITSDVHFVELRSSENQRLARAELADADVIPAGSTTEVQRVDEFVRG